MAPDQVARRAAVLGAGLMRAELEQLLHQTLRSMQVTDSDAHLILEWLADEDDEIRRVWMLRAAGMFVIGLVLGSVVGWLSRSCA